MGANSPRPRPSQSMTRPGTKRAVAGDGLSITWIVRRTEEQIKPLRAGPAFGYMTGLERRTTTDFAVGADKERQAKISPIRDIRVIRCFLSTFRVKLGLI